MEGGREEKDGRREGGKGVREEEDRRERRGVRGRKEGGREGERGEVDWIDSVDCMHVYCIQKIYQSKTFFFVLGYHCG